MRKIHILGLIATAALAVATDALVRIYPPDAGVAMAADEPKRIDFTQAIVDDGVPVIDEVSCPIPVDKATGRPTGDPRPCETPLTLGEAIYRAMRFPDRDVTWDEGMKRDDLARVVRRATDYPILSDQRKLIEKTIPKAYPSAAMVGIVSRMLDGK
jgi:hypothetical protein